MIRCIFSRQFNDDLQRVISKKGSLFVIPLTFDVVESGENALGLCHVIRFRFIRERQEVEPTSQDGRTRRGELRECRFGAEGQAGD